VNYHHLFGYNCGEHEMLAELDAAQRRKVTGVMAPRRLQGNRLYRRSITISSPDNPSYSSEMSSQ
jgi:hypothetical protein